MSSGTYLRPGNPATYSLGVESLTWPFWVSRPFLIICFLSSACRTQTRLLQTASNQFATLHVKCLPFDCREASLTGNFDFSRFANSSKLLTKRDVIFTIRLNATFGPLPHCLGYVSLSMMTLFILATNPWLHEAMVAVDMRAMAAKYVCIYRTVYCDIIQFKLRAQISNEEMIFIRLWRVNSSFLCVKNNSALDTLLNR